MSYRVFIYKDGLPDTVDPKSFTDIRKAFQYLGELDFNSKIKRCVLDDGTKVLFDLKRDEHGRLSSSSTQ